MAVGIYAHEAHFLPADGETHLYHEMEGTGFVEYPRCSQCGHTETEAQYSEGRYHLFRQEQSNRWRSSKGKVISCLVRKDGTRAFQYMRKYSQIGEELRFLKADDPHFRDKVMRYIYPYIKEYL